MNRYIPKGSYRKAKSTNGDEFIEVLSKKPYKGFYIEDLKGNFYGGSTPQENGPELIKIPKLGLIKPEPVGGFFVNKVTQSERENGLLKRYFIQDKNNNKITEVDKQTHLQAQNDLVNTNFAQADWILKGPAEDKTFNGFPFEGAESKNKKTINALESKMPGISTFVTDYKYLVVDPILAQKPVITSQTITQKDNKTQIQDDKKANFDYKSDSIYPGPGILGSEATPPVYEVTTEGLVLSLDAANTASYTEGSAYWYDLSGNNNTAEFMGSTYYQSIPTPSMAFNGTSDYMSIADSNTLSQQSGDFSVETWFIAQGDGMLYEKEEEYSLQLAGNALYYNMNALEVGAAIGGYVELDVWNNVTTTSTNTGKYELTNLPHEVVNATTISYLQSDDTLQQLQITNVVQSDIGTIFTINRFGGLSGLNVYDDIHAISFDIDGDTISVDPEFYLKTIRINGGDDEFDTYIIVENLELTYYPIEYKAVYNMHINGELAHTSVFSTNEPSLLVLNGPFPLTLGARTTGETFFTGNIAITRAYSKALSQAEVAQNYLAIKDRFHL
jgi:hypothetical protein